MGAGTTLALPDDAVAITSLTGLGDESGVLVEDGVPVGFDAGVLPGDVLVVDGDDGVLGNILDHVALSVVVGDVGVLVIVVPPVVAGGEGLVGVGAVEIERVAGLVDDGGKHVVDRADEVDGTVPLEGPAVVCRSVDNMTDPGAHLNGETTELGSHGVDGDVGVLVVAEHPWVSTISVGDVEDLEIGSREVHGRLNGTIGQGLALGGDEAVVPLVQAVARALGHVVQQAIAEVTQAVLHNRLVKGSTRITTIAACGNSVRSRQGKNSSLGEHAW